jgi:hypothetical protein
MKALFKQAAVLAALWAGVGSATAAPTLFQGYDSPATTAASMTNANAAAAAFDAAAPGLSLLTFESGVPGDVSISGGSITNDSGCGYLCGINITAGGAYFLYLYGGSTTISFSSPVNAFGFYVTGLQTEIVPNETVTFSDGSSQVIPINQGTGGGGGFIGVIDQGKLITSVTYSAQNDIVVLDDLRYGMAPVPEPATVGLMLAGIAGLGLARRRRA